MGIGFWARVLGTGSGHRVLGSWYWILGTGFWALGSDGKEKPNRTHGTQGTPALSIISLLSLLLPILRIASAGGPMNTSPSSAMRWAKDGDSERKP
jgi:hypothetical protein